ncbi:B12-binding domain-containing radical SAM protein [Aquihabitans daechungensis]|uniref:B12-binding domain-containing radical SAM protein n=1 Tax=Aquihabitans daechungensis TaxID=1052257 RepID=UPI003B9F3823
MELGDPPQPVSQSVELTASPRRGIVSLIRPPITIFPRSLSHYGPVPPIGLAYLAAVLRDAGHAVNIVDAPIEGMDQYEDIESSIGSLRHVGLSAEQIVDQIPEDVDVVGISNMFLHEWPISREIAEMVRKLRPDALVVLGGENATAFRRWIFEETDAVDCVVIGEGEGTLLTLVDQYLAGASLEDIPGTAMRPGLDLPVRDNGLPVRQRQLAEVPWPAWDLVPLDRYWDYADFHGVNRGRYIPVMATRGCPYQCSFCSSPQMWTTRYVVREPEDIADEIERYVDHFGVKNVNFHDLTAITKRKWTLRFCDALEERNLDLVWQLPVGTRSEALDAEVLQRLWDTGCRNITYAPESGSERMLEIFKKKVDLDHMLESLGEAHRIGLRTRVNIIVGHPDETWPDMWKSLKFLVRAAWRGCDDASVIMFCAYPGSADFERLYESGEFELDEIAMYVGLSRTSSSSHRSYNPRMNSRQMRRGQFTLLTTFYALTLVRRPRRVIEHIVSVLGGRETTTLDQFLRIKWRGFRSMSKW